MYISFLFLFLFLFFLLLLILSAKSLATYLLLQEWFDPGNFDIISKLGIGRREFLILAGKFQLVDSHEGNKFPIINIGDVGSRICCERFPWKTERDGTGVNKRENCRGNFPCLIFVFVLSLSLSLSLTLSLFLSLSISLSLALSLLLPLSLSLFLSLSLSLSHYNISDEAPHISCGRFPWKTERDGTGVNKRKIVGVIFFCLIFVFGLSLSLSLSHSHPLSLPLSLSLSLSHSH